MHVYAKNWANNCRNSIGFDTPLTQGTGLTQSEGQHTIPSTLLEALITHHADNPNVLVDIPAKANVQDWL